MNRQIVLAARPKGWPKETDFRLEETAVPQPASGQFLARNLYMSVDPYMRGRMNEGRSYAKPFELGQPLDGRAVAQIEDSKHKEFAPGDYVTSMFGWRDCFVFGHEVGKAIQMVANNEALQQNAVHEQRGPVARAGIGRFPDCIEKSGRREGCARRDSRAGRRLSWARVSRPDRAPRW